MGTELVAFAENLLPEDMLIGLDSLNGATDSLRTIFDEWAARGGQPGQLNQGTLQPPNQLNTGSADDVVRRGSAGSASRTSTAADSSAQNSGSGSGSGTGQFGQHDAVPKKQGVKVSRWKQSKSKMGDLEQQAAQKKAMFEKMQRENDQLRFRAIAMEHTLAAREKQVEILSKYRRSRSDSQPAPQPPPISAMTAGLREFVGNASLLLLQIANAEQQRNELALHHALDQVAAMVGSFCTEMGTIFVLQPKIQFQMLAYRADTNETSPAEPSHWDHVVTEICATQQQREEVAACWDLNGNTMVKLQNEIAAVRTELAQGIDNVDSERLSELQKRLHAAMLNQAMACRAMGFILFGRILTPVQTARAIIHSFPFFPNARELIIRLLGLAPST